MKQLGSRAMRSSVTQGQQQDQSDVLRDRSDHHVPASFEVAPDDPLQPPFQYHASLHSLDTITPHGVGTAIDSTTPSTPTSTGLRLHVDVLAKHQSQYTLVKNDGTPLIEPRLQQALPSAGLPVRSSSVRSALSPSHHTIGSLSPGSAFSSPGIGPIIDITPLPSPVTPWGSPGSWKRARESQDQKDLTLEKAEHLPSMVSAEDPIAFSHLSPKKRSSRIGYTAQPAGRDAQIYDVKASSHGRNRSFSDFVPDAFQPPRYRHVVVSGSAPFTIEENLTPPTQYLHREEYLAVKRGLTLSGPQLPTPPRSNRDTDGSDSESTGFSPKAPERKHVYYQARSIRNNKLKRWREIRKLGEGTFSTVMLATSEVSGGKDSADDPERNHRVSPMESDLDPKSLVAVKICEHGPAGGADEKKIETSLKRELDILKTINHPSLVHLKAINILESRTLLVLGYCAGGDLYDLALTKSELLVPSLIRRIFAELVAAVRYLHSNYIVHRDIKLENVLVNLKPDFLKPGVDWQTFPSPVVTLTDLGLGRRIPPPPESPLLETRCGSEDYAAPEILLGQPYDGRTTDAWALGVLLYALMEERLPFDQLPSVKRKTLKTHRIARCEWSWQRWAGADGEWDPIKGQVFEGARAVVEGLLVRSRSRWGLEKVQSLTWVSGGMPLESSLRRNEDDDDDDNER